jgi:hypothetical protein
MDIWGIGEIGRTIRIIRGISLLPQDGGKAKKDLSFDDKAGAPPAAFKGRPERCLIMKEIRSCLVGEVI